MADETNQVESTDEVVREPISQKVTRGVSYGVAKALRLTGRGVKGTGHGTKSLVKGVGGGVKAGFKEGLAKAKGTVEETESHVASDQEDGDLHIGGIAQQLA